MRRRCDIAFCHDRGDGYTVHGSNVHTGHVAVNTSSASELPVFVTYCHKHALALLGVAVGTGEEATA